MRVIVQQKGHAREILELKAAIYARDYLVEWELTAPVFHDPLFAATYRQKVYSDAFDQAITKGGIN